MDQEELKNIAKMELESIERKIEELNNLIENAHTQRIPIKDINIVKETIKVLEEQKEAIIEELENK